jgi:D-alanyl-D-alanine carboxypeptidase/D-alanyl-D-alanine-endopeptidase (penicillin-binding protein 4)
MDPTPEKLSRRIVLAGLLAGLAVPGHAQRLETSIRPRPRPGVPAEPLGASGAAVRAGGAQAAANRFVEAAKLGGRTSYALIDIRTGRLVESRDETLAQPPASVSKALTSLYGLDRLGEQHRFVTSVIAQGIMNGSRLEGDLVLVGSGDPTLDTDRLADLAAALKAKGLREVTGRFLVFAGALPQLPNIDPGQPDHVGYNPALSGLNLNFNRVHFEWKRGQNGWQVGMDARGARHMPRVAMANVRIVQRESPLFTYERRDRLEQWTVASAALGKGGSRWLPVRQPEIYTGEVFQTLCNAQGLRLPAPQVNGQTPRGGVLAQVSSEDMRGVLRSMMRHSTNLTAEVVGLSSSGARSLAASGARMSDWLGHKYGIEARLVDHSGLGGASRISALALAQVMARAQSGPLRSLMRDFGTQAARTGKNVKGGPSVQAKTGTLNFVSGLSGYVTTAGGREMAFAILSADTSRREGLRGAERERPTGGPQWARRARTLQGELLELWSKSYA